MDSKDWILLVAGLIIGGFAVYLVVKNPNVAASNFKTATVSNGCSSCKLIAENAETIQWTDYKGNKRQIAVHREVRG